MTTPIPLPAEVSPTTLPLPDPEAYEGEPREYARALMQRKTEIEAEIVCPLIRALARASKGKARLISRIVYMASSQLYGSLTKALGEALIKSITQTQTPH